MNRTWKVVALTSTFWALVLAVVVLVVAPPVLDWRGAVALGAAFAIVRSLFRRRQG